MSEYTEWYKEKLVQRINLRKKIQEQPEIIPAVIEKCKRDPLYFMDNFAYSFNPKAREEGLNPKRPFIPYPGKQREYIRKLHKVIDHPQDLFVDKMRDGGITTLTMVFCLWGWLFLEGFAVHVGSRKESYVDVSGSPNTLFHKIDYALLHLPDFLKPIGYEERRHRNHMRLKHPTLDNVITGESSNPNFGRGGRATLVIFDEIGFWQYAKSAWSSAGDVSEARIAITTPPQSGKSSFAYKLLDQRMGKIEVFSFEYIDIPGKNKEWLKKQKERRSDEEFEREILKSYSGTLEGKVYAENWQLHVKEDKNLEYDPYLPLYVSWDFGRDGTAMIWWQIDKAKDEIYMIDCYEGYQQDIEFFVPFVTGIVHTSEYTYKLEEIMKIKKHSQWKKNATHFGDPNVKSTHVSSKLSTYEVLASHGIIVNSKPFSPNKGFYEMKQNVLQMIKKLTVNPVTCADVIDAMESSRYPNKREASESTTEADKPVHDEYSHFRTSVEYFADHEKDLVNTRTRNKAKKPAKIYKRY